MSTECALEQGTANFEVLLAQASARRAGLIPLTNAYRVFHGWSEGLPGLAIDRWDHAVTIEARESLSSRLEKLVIDVRDVLAPSTIIVKLKGAVPELADGHEVGTIAVVEDGIRYLVEPARPRNPGLYLDARDARLWIRENSSGRRILNLFAFTGSLGLAAAMGGALSVSHVDMQRSALRRVRDNYRANDLRIDDRDLVRLNLYHHLRRQSAKRRRYDGVIIDAPPYSPHSDRTPGDKGVFALARLARKMLNPGGWMLCFFHHFRRPLASLETDLLAALDGDDEVCWRGSSGIDFPEQDDTLKSQMVAVRAVRD